MQKAVDQNNLALDQINVGVENAATKQTPPEVNQTETPDQQKVGEPAALVCNAAQNAELIHHIRDKEAVAQYVAAVDKKCKCSYKNCLVFTQAVYDKICVD